MTAPALLPFATPVAGRPAGGLSGETLLGHLPGVTADRRTAVVTRRSLCGAESVLLREESFSPAVGWFPQGGVELAADQIGGLRALMGAAAPATRTRPAAGAGPATVPFRRAG